MIKLHLYSGYEPYPHHVITGIFITNKRKFQVTWISWNWQLYIIPWQFMPGHYAVQIGPVAFFWCKK